MASANLWSWEQAREFYTIYSPWIVTELHLIGSALLPIFAGSHASLSRPLSAAKPIKKGKKGRRKDDDEDQPKMEGLSPSDAIVYPLFTGLMLTGLYYLIKWLQDPEILNKIINWYLSIFGVFAVSRFLTDIMTTTVSFAFPLRYFHQKKVWKARLSKDHFTPATAAVAKKDRSTHARNSPWPGMFSNVPMPAVLQKMAWSIRRFLTRPLFVFEAYVHGVVEASLAVGPLAQINIIVALAAILYYNLVDKPWWLTNLMGFSFAYGALQLMSPTTFWTGTLVLTALFFYDIYFVFFTPMMITVATKLDIPVKLLFPRPADKHDDPKKQPLSMLGLGDVVLPGMMIGLALRFDLYVFYLKKQNREGKGKRSTIANGNNRGKQQTAAKHRRGSDGLIYDHKGIGRAEYKRATGSWGERFWLGSAASSGSEGGVFPKTYFYASIAGYILGLVVTLSIMHIYKHGQPALLYLVPGVLLSLWGTALVRGELQTMWAYTELDEEEVEKEKQKLEESTKAAKDKIGQIQEAVKRTVTGDEPLDSSGDEDNEDATEDKAMDEPESEDERKSSSVRASKPSADSKSDSDSEPTSMAHYETLPTTRPPRSLVSFSIRLPKHGHDRDEHDSQVKSASGLGKGVRRVASTKRLGPGGEKSRASGRSTDGVELADATGDSPSRNTRNRGSRRRS